MSRQVRTRAMLERTSQRACGDRSIPALANPSRRLRNWPSIPSPQCRPLAWRNAEDDAKHWNGRSTRSPLLQPEAWQTTGYGSTAVWSHRHPYIGAFQTSVYLERQSPVFSLLTLGHSLGAFPAPHHPVTHRPRAGDPDSADCELLLFPDSSPNQMRWVPTPENAALALGAGRTRVASRKSVPRVIRANTTKEKTSWHSTPTPSL